MRLLPEHSRARDRRRNTTGGGGRGLFFIQLIFFHLPFDRDKGIWKFIFLLQMAFTDVQTRVYFRTYDALMGGKKMLKILLHVLMSNASLKCSISK